MSETRTEWAVQHTMYYTPGEPTSQIHEFPEGYRTKDAARELADKMNAASPVDGKYPANAKAVCRTIVVGDWEDPA